MNIAIKRAAAEDMPAILSVLNYGVKNKIRRGDLAWGINDLENATIEPYIQNGTAFIAQLGDQVVGTFVLDWQDEINWGKQPPSACYLHRFAVAAGYGGQNVGGQILDLIAKIINEQRSLSSIRLVCPSSNGKLRAYYEKQGFTRADAKARPSLPRQNIVYYERPVGDIMPETIQKSSLLTKLRSIKFNRSSLE